MVMMVSLMPFIPFVVPTGSLTTLLGTVTDLFDYTFPENGLVGFKDGVQFHKMELKTYLNESQIKELVNFLLHYMADLDIPIKRYGAPQ